MHDIYDVIVVGAGHAGCEAALAAARMDCHTLLLTMNLDNTALMPCNPSIGGPAKGHLVREIDALGGEMALNTDKTFIQIRKLNTSKGPAVQALRAQSDKMLYGRTMKHTLESQENLVLKQALVEELGLSSSFPLSDATSENRADFNDRPCSVDSQTFLWVKTHLGAFYKGKTVILTIGTSLGGRVIIGDRDFAAGRAGEFGAYKLSESLKGLGLSLGRLKTGTPPRINARTIDFSKTDLYPGSPHPLYFSFKGKEISPAAFPPANPVYPPGPEIAWRSQLPCYLVYTNEKTHEIIKANLHRAPLFTGFIKALGPRYCPSIEDKIVRFAHHGSHGLFLEPEGWETNEVYVQGGNTSLPEDVQLAMLRSIPALAKVEIMRVGYAIEYDFVPPSQISSSLEVKSIPGLFLAGQINGTTGYEEAAAQGLLAGINAALKVKGKAPLLLRRDQAYMGVMVDDLVTRELTEPYRLFTSRAEYRLLLRGDNADLRLSSIGYQLGLVPAAVYQAVENKRQLISDFIYYLQKHHLSITEGLQKRLEERGMAPVNSSLSLSNFLRRQEVNLDLMAEMGLVEISLPPDVKEQVEIEAKYQGYLERQRWLLERVKKLEERLLPSNLDYSSMEGLRLEAKQKLERFRPATLGQASRLEGVTPADIAVVLVTLEKSKAKIRAQS